MITQNTQLLTFVSFIASGKNDAIQEDGTFTVKHPTKKYSMLGSRKKVLARLYVKRHKPAYSTIHSSPNQSKHHPNNPCVLSSADATEVRMRQQPPPPTPQPLRTLAFLGRRPASGGLFLKAPSLQPFLPLAPLGVSRRNALGRWPASGGLLLKAPSPQPSRPSAPFAFQRRLLRAVLGLRPRKCSRVADIQAPTRDRLYVRNTFAAALTDAHCPAARSPAAPTWLGLSACALLSGLLL